MPPTAENAHSNYRIPQPALLNDAQLRSAVESLIEHKKALALPVLWSVSGDQVVVKDLAEINNLLIVGSSRQGKTNFVHQLLLSLLFTKYPNELKLLLIDLKGSELIGYDKIGISHLVNLTNDKWGTVTRKADSIDALNRICAELDHRIDLFKKTKSKDLRQYNDTFLHGGLGSTQYGYKPWIIVVIDDLQDVLHLDKNETAMPLVRILAKGYTYGIYTILCSNEARNESIPTIFRAHLEGRVAFRLFDKVDYRMIVDTIDVPFTEKGNFVYLERGRVEPGQSVPIAPKTIELVAGYILDQPISEKAFVLEKEIGSSKEFDSEGLDEFFYEAARLTIDNQVGSTSLIQRRMKLGYNRAGRLMDQLEAAGIVGPGQGSKPREVLIKTRRDLDILLSASGQANLTDRGFIGVQQSQPENRENGPASGDLSSSSPEATPGKKGCLMLLILFFMTLAVYVLV